MRSGATEGDAPVGCYDADIASDRTCAPGLSLARALGVGERVAEGQGVGRGDPFLSRAVVLPAEQASA